MAGLKDKVVVGSVEKGNGVTEYSVKSTAAKDYKITIDKEGYIFQTLNVKVPAATTEEKTITKTVEMRKLVVNAVSILRNIYFDFEKATFKTESYGELNRLEAMMKQNPALQVEISGHTDKIGTKAYNKKLSLMRANAVRGFLTSKGVDPRRVKTVGYGEDRPIASNDDDKEGRELNRRVEFKVLGN
jgi:outer membrane protein OmpA-like peptidoglycan-associated protein